MRIALGYLPINYKDAYYRKFNKKIRLRVTEKISSEIINLPCHQYMTEKEIVKISKKILALI